MESSFAMCKSNHHEQAGESKVIVSGEDMGDDGLPVAGPAAWAEALEVDLLKQKQVQPHKVEVVEGPVAVPEGGDLSERG